jgi:hydrogenase maturation protein HypF
MSAPETCDVLLRVRGTVQGVGFRPFVLRTANRLGLRGWVCNDAQGVLVRAAGPRPAVDALVDELQSGAPPAARVTAVERQPVPPAAPRPVAGFAIAASEPGKGPVETAVPVELALCAACRRELLDPADRRFGYPLINCTQCGPRYSIIEHLPYDRPATTMRAFPMCPACQAEYDDPANRRHHAQPNACPACGPQLAFTDGTGRVEARREAALARAAGALRGGAIVAVKGLGGFHLMCDATNAPAVAALRARKHRDEKPLAVMFRDPAQLRRYAEVSTAAEGLLVSPASPIVLVPRLPDTALAAGIAPENPWLGALLASTPLHVLLLGRVDFPVVATSANLAEEPLCIADDEARSRLAGIADHFLGHDRAIARPVDDSVVRLTGGGTPVLLRRARGYAPTPMTLPAALTQPVLCVGAQMKNAVVVGWGRRLVLSPHIGDLDNAVTRDAFRRTVGMLTALHATPPAVVVHDKHPDYASTRHAAMLGLPTVAVQHHLAHVLACLLEHGVAADGVLGLAWDGTGWGEDGTVWGGEFILLQRGRAQRFAALRPFRLAGGEAAVRDARRTALGLVHAGAAGEFASVAARLGVSAADLAVLAAMLERGLNSPWCSSMGRLFDAAGALLGLGRRNAFEGQMPLAVEAAAWADQANDLPVVNFALEPGGPGMAWSVDWGPALTRLLDHRGGVPVMARAFHRGLAQAAVDVARRAGVETVALTGGCFQNVLLHELTAGALTAAGFRVLVHRELSPNDGSIAAGQALGALWNLTTVEPM